MDRGDVRVGDRGSRFVTGVDETGVVRASWGFCRTVDEDLAWEAVTALDELAQGYPRPLCIDVSGVVNVTRGGRDAFTQAASASKVALFGRSPVARVVASFVLGTSRLPVPARYFTSESAALAWLRTPTPPPPPV